MKSIIVTVAKDGSTKVETRGFTGPACQVASKFLEKSLGFGQSEVLTADFYARQPSKQQLQEGV